MRDTTLFDTKTTDRKPVMSLCIGICQMDDYGYCVGCGRTQAEIDGSAPPDAQAGAEATGSGHEPSPAPLEPR